MTSDEKKTVVDRLEAYKKHFDDLLALLGNLPLQPRDKTKAQQMLKKLKASLKKDYMIGDTIRGQEQMTPAERQYFHPAVHEAYTAIHVRWNTVPSEQWFSELYDARINITHMLHQLK